MQATLQRLMSTENVLDSWPQWKCCIHGSRVVKTSSRKFLFFHKIDVVYHVRVASETHRWIVHYTYADFRALHAQLLEVGRNDNAFMDALSHFALPREHLFGRRDMLVIKGMCGTLEHYLVNLLRYCQRHRGPATERMDAVVRDFLRPNRANDNPIDVVAGKLAKANLI
ncbi:hypothetical protein ACHHYP_07026 [Achlya hypogyna]|uniref:PX domain-containing protein n=1 Tax=Achlya hypogyna TaxID=1202772 RepID=A0A1V9YRE5_ACHHY|nr:hypothetical protein ACHHYP_07026 [Achlya hypogyna]